MTEQNPAAPDKAPLPEPVAADRDVTFLSRDASDATADPRARTSGLWAVDEDGRVYVVDQWFRKLEVFRPAAVKANSGFLARRGAAAAILSTHAGVAQW